MRRLPLLVALFVAPLLLSATASAGIIADENAKSGWGRWPVTRDGTANGAGVVDVYPGRWSLAAGETLRLKVRSTAGYNVRILRLGWYGGATSRQIAFRSGLSADTQPYPFPDSKYGMAQAGWHDTVTFSTSGWLTGMYVARVERSDGYQAETIFTVRDDNGPRMPILLVTTISTHQAYNAWPHARRGGKSLYSFNSSSSHPTESLSHLTQAVKVSFDRPFLVGGGTGDFGNYEYPMVQYLEENGWDVAYAQDADLHVNPSIAKNRKAVIISGHSEYWTRGMFDAALSSRDSRVNWFISSGDTLSWQVRFESGPAGPYSTMVGYKESWVKDPVQKLAASLRSQGRYSEAAAQYRYVTRGWKNLAYYPEQGIDERRPGMIMTGVMSAGIIRNADGSIKGSYPYADLRVTNPSHWIFSGTGISFAYRIPGIMGYEVDSTLASNSYFDPWRPANQFRLGQIRQVSDDKIKGSSAIYRKSFSDGSRAEVVAMGAIDFAWGLSDFPHPGTENFVAKRMVKNALTRWTAPGFGTSAYVYEPEEDGNDLDPTPDPDGQPHEQEPIVNEESEGSSAEGFGCSMSAKSSDATVVGLTIAGLGLALAARRRRR
jgi:MYXO-CTERM domain-containing protein